MTNNCDEWTRLAETAATVTAAKQAVDDAQRQLDNQHGWPWRVSKRGNLITADDVIVMRPLGTRAERRAQARQALATIRYARTSAEQRLTDALATYEAVRPAEPGLLYGVPCTDITRVTARQVADAINLHESCVVAIAKDNVITFNFGAAYAQR